MKADVTQALQTITERGWGRRSTLFLVMFQNYQVLKQALDRGEATIVGIGRALAEQGATDLHNKRPTDRCAQQTWRRVVEAHSEMEGSAHARQQPAAAKAAPPAPAQPRRHAEAIPDGVRTVPAAAAPPPAASERSKPSGIDTDAILSELDQARPWAAPRRG